MKKAGIVLFAFVLLLVTGYLWTRQKRNLASADPAMQLEFAQIKTHMIQAIEWKDEGDHNLFRIESGDPEFCKNWSEAKIEMVAEGLGVSGDAPGAFAKAQCEQGRIQIQWPKHILKWNDPIQKTGDYIETPAQFYIGAIELQGEMGLMRISNYEISSVRSETFTLTLEPSH